MFYVYVLRSKKDRQLYMGYANNLRHRVEEHNTGKVESTRSRIPFDLIYYEAYSDKADAMHREDMLKLRAKALGQLKRRIRGSMTVK